MIIFSQVRNIDFKYFFKLIHGRILNVFVDLIIVRLVEFEKLT